MLELWQGRTNCSSVPIGQQHTHVYAIDEEETEISEYMHDIAEELQTRSLLEENENEQWQEVISRRDQQKVEECRSCLTVEC